MTRPNSKNSSAKTANARRLRQLRFDVLEDRRLLAGIDVFVFDDVDGSRSFNSLKDGTISDRAVYVDLNNDGKLSSSEPWTVSDANGVARFPNLEPGVYAVRLLSNNKSVQQTFPTQPEDQGAWADGLGITKVLRVESSGLTWGISGNSLSLVNVAANQTVKSISFGSATVIDAAFDPVSSSGNLSGFVLARNQDQSQVLWQVSTAGSGTKQATGVDVTTSTQLVTIGNKVLVLGDGNLKEIYQLEAANGTKELVLKSTGISGIPASAVVNASGSNSVLILEDGSVSNRLSLYQLKDGLGQLVGKRSFPSNVISWEVSSDGVNIAVSTADDFMILSPEPGLPTKAILADAVGPIVFDPIRNLMITSTASDPSRLTGWSLSNWSQGLSIPVSNGRSLAGTRTKLYLDDSGTQLVGVQNGGLYQQSIATAAAAIANVVSSGITKLQIGVRSIGVNRKPKLESLDAIAVDEDQQLGIDTARIRSKTSDSDGDPVIYVVRTNPTNGKIDWNQDALGVYLPLANANGNDFITIQAYDGRDWSMPQALPIVINPIDDLPTGIELSVDSIEENPTRESSLATIQTMDPDADANYQYEVNDSRFSVVEGILRLVNGSIDFEEEPLIVLAITGTDGSHPKDTILRSITLSVRDVNEAPTGIRLPSKLSVPELTEDVELGRISAIDQDANEEYSWTVSDSRFAVVKGILRLSKGSMLDFESEPTVTVVLSGKDGSGQFGIERAVTVTVTDQNDEPAGLVLTSTATIREHETGKVIGNVSVLDPDLGEAYSFGISDSRFEVVRGAIKLKDGLSVSYVEPGYIDLTVTATSLSSGSRLSGKLRLNILRDPTPYHNDVNPYDVDGDGILTPLDPLILINYINDKGVGPIEKPGEGEGTLPDLDVDGDGEVTPIDILILINKLNQQNDDEFDSGFPVPVVEGEGEGSDLVEVDSELTPKVQTVLLTPGLQAGPNLNDASLASYLSDINDVVGPQKLRRR